jgi:hypothetical protein
VLKVQTDVLDRLMGESVAARLLDSSFKSENGKKALSLSELYDNIQGAIWSDLKGSGDISLMRRNLQREHVKRVTYMLTRANGGPADARSLQRENARTWSRSSRPRMRARGSRRRRKRTSPTARTPSRGAEGAHAAHGRLMQGS